MVAAITPPIVEVGVLSATEFAQLQTMYLLSAFADVSLDWGVHDVQLKLQIVLLMGFEPAALG